MTLIIKTLEVVFRGVCTIHLTISTATLLASVRVWIGSRSAWGFISWIRDQQRRSNARTAKTWASHRLVDDDAGQEGRQTAVTDRALGSIPSSVHIWLPNL